MKAVLPDAAALPGWRHIGRSRAETDPYTCMIWTRKDPCRDVLVTGSANFTRGPQRTTRWLRFSFFVFSCRTTSAAHHLYSKLPDYRPLPAEAKRPKLGDESAASRNLLNGEHPTAEIYNKIRVGHTVVLTFAAGLEKAVTAENHAHNPCEPPPKQSHRPHDSPQESYTQVVVPGVISNTLNTTCCQTRRSSCTKLS
ncbi:hypothetical protein ACVHNB_14425 [Streptomyces sp. YJ-C3]